MFTKKATKSLYANCGLECNKSTTIDQPTIDHQESKDPLSGRSPKEDEIMFTWSLLSYDSLNHEGSEIAPLCLRHEHKVEEEPQLDSQERV